MMIQMAVIKAALTTDIKIQLTLLTSSSSTSSSTTRFYTPVLLVQEQTKCIWVAQVTYSFA